MQLNNIENISAIIISEFYGIVYLPINKVSEIMPYINNYIFELTPQIFTLNDITPLELSQQSLYFFRWKRCYFRSNRYRDRLLKYRISKGR